jgi:hypothetical protein
VLRALWDHVDAVAKDKEKLAAFCHKHKHCYRLAEGLMH